MSIDQLSPEASSDNAAENRPDFLAYTHNADQVLSSLRPDPDKKHIDLNDLQQTYAEHVEQQPNPDLREQAHLMIFAVAARQWQHEKDLSVDAATRDEKINKLVAYNHAISEFIYSNPGNVFRDDLARWLGRASGDEEWAQEIVSGAAGEVAVRRVLAKTDRVVDVHPGSLIQDRHGIDLLAAVNNPKLGIIHYGIDVKVRHDHTYFDHLEPEGTREVDGQRLRRVRFNVNGKDLRNDFTVNPDGVKTQVKELVSNTRMPLAY